MSKIMFINSVVDFGSTGRIVRTLAETAKGQGDEVCIVYGRKDSIKMDDTFYMGNTISTLNHVFMTRLFGNHGLHSNNATKKLIDKIKSFNPDIIHLHNLHGYYLNVPMLLKYLNGTDIKIVWTLHDAWIISSSSASFLYNGCKEWDEGCVKCNNTKDYPEVILFPNEKRNFKWKKDLISKNRNLTIVTPSEWLNKLVSDSFLKNKSIITINNGIDTEVFTPNAFNKLNTELSQKIGNRKVLLGVASDWEFRKGLSFLEELSQKVSDKYVVVVVGVSQQQKNHLPDNMIGVLRTNNTEELAALYANAFAYINPTLDDNFPTTNLEALSCGTPVITFDTGGSGESVSPTTGIVVQERCTEAIQQAILFLETNKEVINYKEECRNRAINKYDHKRFVKEQIKLYNDILKKGLV
ncbi:glycosyltransferase [Erysipelothrix urinaevulpis]|uniref:glycosyltransferase n=1 Tax=Erysipelothrix urinaevulpis TaxID=2683717 RepID=UPI00135980BA|nr:glycosyltransferase [Erysipelothrix urinaevulpis]